MWANVYDVWEVLAHGDLEAFKLAVAMRLEFNQNVDRRGQPTFCASTTTILRSMINFSSRSFRLRPTACLERQSFSASTSCDNDVSSWRSRQELTLLPHDFPLASLLIFLCTTPLRGRAECSEMALHPLKIGQTAHVLYKYISMREKSALTWAARQKS